MSVQNQVLNALGGSILASSMTQVPRGLQMLSKSTNSSIFIPALIWCVCVIHNKCDVNQNNCSFEVLENEIYIE